MVKIWLAKEQAIIN